jgi:hypothetical protein
LAGGLVQNPFGQIKANVSTGAGKRSKIAEFISKVQL